MKQNNLDFTDVLKLMCEYGKAGGSGVIIRSDIFGVGVLLLWGDGLKTAVVRSPIPPRGSSVSPASSIRYYQKTPKCYLKYATNNKSP